MLLAFPMTAARRERRLRPRREPRQERAAETRARLLDAAARVFEDRGYDGGTTNRIAEAASMSVGSLYQYFPNKDAILVELMVGHIAEGGERVRAAVAEARAADADLEVLTGSVVAALLALHREAPRLHQILMTRVPLPPDVAARIEALEAAIVLDLVAVLRERAGRTGEEGDVVRAAMAAATVNALVHQQGSRPDPPIPDPVFLAETTRIVVGYLTGAGGDTGGDRGPGPRGTMAT